jgi:hypothetical protein
MFCEGATFAGQSVEDVAGALRSGALSPASVAVQYIVRNGNTLILNTRSGDTPRTRAGAQADTSAQTDEVVHRGRIQIQGDAVEQSWLWARTATQGPGPLPRRRGHCRRFMAACRLASLRRRQMRSGEHRRSSAEPRLAAECQRL